MFFEEWVDFEEACAFQYVAGVGYAEEWFDAAACSCYYADASGGCYGSECGVAECFVCFGVNAFWEVWEVASFFAEFLAFFVGFCFDVFHEFVGEIYCFV